MSEDIHITMARSYYTSYREAVGCPPMITIKSPWGFTVEAKDGSILLEGVDVTNAWEAKSYGVKAWNEKFGEVE